MLLNSLHPLQMKLICYLQILHPQKLSSDTPAKFVPMNIANDFNFIIQSLILMVGQCPDCAAFVNIEHLPTERMGLIF